MNSPMSISMAADLVDLSITRVYGFEKPDPVTSDMDEYTLYNRNREAKYAAENARMRTQMRLIGLALLTLIAVGVYLLT